MKRILSIFGLVAALAAVVVMTAIPVFAANPHFVGTPTATDLGNTLQVQGSIAGLGNQNIDVNVTAQGTATVTCTNPAGNVAPGQSFNTSVTGSQTGIAVENGRANFTVTTVAPTAPAGSCPNNKWTASVGDVTFTSFTVTVIQPSGSGNVVLTQTFPA